MDAFSSSWPAAAFSLKILEPPRPPARKPSDADWEVPLLELPTRPSRKRTSSTDESCSTAVDELLPLALDGGAEEDEDQSGVFAFENDGGCETDEEESGARSQLELIGLDDDFPDLDEAPIRVCRQLAHGMHQRRPRSVSELPTLGASPVLLSALEQVAAKAGMHSPGRPRRDTM